MGEKGGEVGEKGEGSGGKGGGKWGERGRELGMRYPLSTPSVIADSLEECIARLKVWKEGMEGKGLRVNMKKTKLVVSGPGLDLLRDSGAYSGFAGTTDQWSAGYAESEMMTKCPRTHSVQC